jgi:thioredoxin reductase
MKGEIDQLDYDIALIGAGAYGFHLAAHAKRSGKKAVHMGGALQLLFGIRGKRWEDPNYGNKYWNVPKNAYVNLMNENWIRPGEINKPSKVNLVEDACYW